MKAFTNWTHRNPLIAVLGGALLAVALWAAWNWDASEAQIDGAAWAATARGRA
jgi:hypothetical protein